MATTETRVIDPTKNVYTWEGWGTCLSWWANTDLGMRDDLARALFGRDTTTVETSEGPDVEVEGLGLNVVRYVYAQYTRHIRPGSKIVDGGSPWTIAAYDEEHKRLTLVTVNNGIRDDGTPEKNAPERGTPRVVTFNLDKFSRAEGEGDSHGVRVWTTDAQRDPGRRYTRERNLHLDGKSLTVSLEGRTITTLVIDNTEI